jgi:hypothetical protein
MTAKRIITPGLQFSKLTVIEEVSKDLWLCLCSCGCQKVFTHKTLRSGSSQSCGCLRKQNVFRKHGHAGVGPDGRRSAIYRVWCSMMQRCYRVKDVGYQNYGGRGVRVCPRWHDFPNFLEDMGEVPEGFTLDRKDSTGDYSPENCRWATMTEQCRNRSVTRKIEFRGEVRPVAEWAEIIGLNYNCLRRRLSIGWPIEKALTTPILDAIQVSALGASKRWPTVLQV